MAAVGTTQDVLTPEEKTRRIVLHFDLPLCLMSCDPDSEITTECVIPEMLAKMSWGTINADNNNWVCASEEASWDPPGGNATGYVSYWSHLEDVYPYHKEQDDDLRQEYKERFAEALKVFTNKGQPGQKMKSVKDQITKCLALPSAVRKAYSIVPTMDEASVPVDPDKTDKENIVRTGFYQILPGFYKMVDSLNRDASRSFAVAFRSYGKSSQALDMVTKEWSLYCDGDHPAFKKSRYNGVKGSRDLRIPEENKGIIAVGREPRLSFPARTPKAGHGDEEDRHEGEAPGDESPKAPKLAELYTGLSEIHSGIVYDTFHKERPQGIAIHDEGNQGALVLVNPAETTLQPIYFRSSWQGKDPRIVDAVTGQQLSEEDSSLYVVDVDLHKMITESTTYLESLVHEALDRYDAQLIDVRTNPKKIELPKAAAAAADMDAADYREAMLKLSHMEYLKYEIYPALLPAIESANQSRPEDPMLFIALQLLQYPEYKTLKEPVQDVDQQVAPTGA